MSELAALSLTQARDALLARQASPLELLESCLARIERLNPQLNAFLTITEEAARLAAARAQQRLTSGEQAGPLEGVPLAHKDMFWRKGETVTGGSKILSDITGQVTAPTIARLDRAGAVDVGRLNMSEFAAGSTGHNVHYGDCLNPWDPRRITGGSSSGSGASVSARMVFGALGSDTGGSVRNPAAYCGLYGLRPTQGAVTLEGCMPRSWSLDTIGPLARSIDDIALLFSVIADQNAISTDPSTWGQAESLRVGVADHLINDGHTAPVVADLLDDLRRALETTGTATKTIDLPDFTHLFDLGQILLNCEATSMHADWLDSRPDDYGRVTRVRVANGRIVSAVEYLDAKRERGQWLAKYLEAVFERVDLVLLPVTRTPAPLYVDMEVGNDKTVAKQAEDLTYLTRPLSYLGLPALTIPCGFTPEGLPVGAQLVAAPHREQDLFALAKRYEQDTHWLERQPPVN